MKLKKVLALCLCCTFILSGCGSSDSDATETAEDSTVSDGSHATVCTVDLTEGKYSDEKLDSSWDAASATSITLADSASTASSDAVTIDGDIITITESGTYVVSGELSNGQLIIETPNKGDVKLVLNGVTINNNTSSAIYVKEGKTVVVLADGTTNTFTDGESYVFEDGEDEPDATIFAKDDLSFNGNGTLIVTSNYKDAIKCKDDLKFISGNFEITAADDAVVGKDSVSVKDGTFLIASEGDSIKSTNAEESDKGYIMIDNGSFQLVSSKDALVAETLLRVNDGDFTITTGELSSQTTPDSQDVAQMSTQPSGGQRPSNDPMSNGKDGRGGDPFAGESSGSSENAVSTKGMKSFVELVIAGGTFDITSEDDAIHSNQNVTIEDGVLTIATGDDGIHAEKTLTINNGTINIEESYEGLEAFDIIVNDGDITLHASDDGINAAGDADSASNPEDDEEAETDGTNPKDNFSNFRGAGGMMEAEDQGATLTINGGTLLLYASGDVIDINGDGVINGGTVIAQGPTNGGNGTLDYASTFDVKGGTFWGVGSSGMAMNPTSDTQGVICGTVQETISAGTTISVADEDGNVVEELEVETQGQWLGVCSPKIEKNASYTLTIGTSKYSATAS